VADLPRLHQPPEPISRRTRDPKEFVAACAEPVVVHWQAVAAPVIPKSLWRLDREDACLAGTGRRTRDPKEFVAGLVLTRAQASAVRRRTRDPKEFVAETTAPRPARRPAVAAPVIPKSLWRLLYAWLLLAVLWSPHP